MRFSSTIRLRSPACSVLARSAAAVLALASLLLSGGCLDPVQEGSGEGDAGPDLHSSFGSSDQTSGYDIGALGGDADAAADSAGLDAGDGAGAELPDSGLSDGALVDGQGDATPVDDAAPNDDTGQNPDATGDLAGDSTSSDSSSGCGDGKCSGGAGESCLNCPADCGACPAFCGNATCDSGETCSSCAADCGACPGPVCDVLTSKNCPSSQQCFPDGKQNLCYPAGVKVHGEPCSLANDCTIGVLCVAGLCRSLCDYTGANPAATCKPGLPCEKLVFDGAGEVGQGLGVCKPAAACDPLSDSGCPDGQKCNPSGWFKSCASPGSGANGSVCNASSQCEKGLLCHIGSSGSGLCRPRCHTGGGSPACASGSCTPMLDSAGQVIPGNVGTCFL